MSFVLAHPLIKGDLAITRAEGEDEINAKEGLIVDVSSAGETKRMYLLGGRGYGPNPSTIVIAGLTVDVSYSSKIYRTTFKVEMREFIGENFPGTETDRKCVVE